jgi:hypothetical protein
MQNLAFPSYDFRLKSSENKPFIFDVVRKKFVSLAPEEWVRQNVLHFLIYTKKYPLSLINVEKEIKVGDTKKRYDIVIFHPDGSIFLIVECKSYTIPINQGVFDQIARYNLQLESDLLMVTNGMEHFYCSMDYKEERYAFLRELPDYSVSN